MPIMYFRLSSTGNEFSGGNDEHNSVFASFQIVTNK